MKKNYTYSALMALFAPFVSVSMAQTVPDAGSLRENLEQGREASLPRKAVPIQQAEPAAMRPLFGVVITVKQFHLVGNTLISAEQLQQALAAYLNRPLDYTQLQAAAAAVANVYRASGWIVRAYLPQQDIVDGVVTIQIVEAAFGGVKIEGAAATRVPLAQIQGDFDAQQQVGAPLNSDAIDRALLLVSDLPGVTASGSLREGTQTAQTDLVLSLASSPLMVGDAQVDNTGSRSTGANRLAANVNFNSLFGVGDLLNSNLIHTEGSDYVRVGGTAPLGYDGWRAGANASAMRYRLVSAEFSALHSVGTSSSIGLEASYPLIRSRLRNLYFLTNADYKTYDNQASGVTTTHYDVNSLSLGLSGNQFDNLGAGGANSASLNFSYGHLNLDNSPNQAADAASTRTDGSYTKLRYSASRQQVINDDVSVFVAGSGQWANKNLDSSEKFYLGGASGVRAYPSSEAGGAAGQIINLELRWRLSDGFHVAGFYDYGQVRVNANNNFVGALALNNYDLKGAGLSLAWQSNSGLNFKATLARRIGVNPNPITTGKDQDGSLVKNRLWLSASVPF